MSKEKEKPKTKKVEAKKEDAKKTQPRKLKGMVVSTKMQKTIVVAVNKFVQHKKYKKRYRVTKKYKAHDEKEEYSTGQKVIIQETSPISKDKTWIVIGLTN